MKRKILLIILILWTAFVFYNSIKTAADSIKDSSLIVDTVKKVIEYTYDDQVPEAIEYYIDNNFQTTLRNFAHGFEFFVLYILVYLNIRYLNMCGLKLLLNGLYVCLFVAIIDENIQIFVKGRGFQVSDLITDLFGSLIALGIVYIISKYIKKDYGVCRME